MLASDIETARFNMIEQQIRPCEVIDERVLRIYEAIPREAFVSDEYAGLAYADIAVPIGEGEEMMKPVQEARMLQAVDVQPGDQILEIGTGSGFMAACMARLGGTVTSYEIHPTLHQQASGRLREFGIHNAELISGDGLKAGMAAGRFKVVAVTGSLPTYPSFLENLVAPGGRMFAVVGKEPAMTAMLVSRSAEGELWRESLFETVLPPLHNAPQPDRFVF